MKIQLWLFKFQHKAGAFDKKKGSLRGPNIISIAVREVREECYIRLYLYHYTKNVSFAFNIHFIVSVVVHKDFRFHKKKNIPNK